MIDTLAMALALAAQAGPEPVSITPAQFAQAIQGVIGQTFEGGGTVTRIYADGQIVVIVLDGPAGWRTPASAGQASDLFITSFCEGRDFEYFVRGNAMRIDTTEAGAAGRPGPVVRACPPPDPNARPQ
jgi:hypothetical protein